MNKPPFYDFFADTAFVLGSILILVALIVCLIAAVVMIVDILRRHFRG